ELHNVGLVLLGTRRYKQAAADGNQKSLGNLARLLGEGGFIDEAREWLAKAVSNDSHISDTAATLVRSQEMEKQNFLAINRRGDDLHVVMRNLVIQDATP